MMKKPIAIVLALVMALTLAACGGGNDAPSGGETTAPPASQGDNTPPPDSSDAVATTPDDTTPPPTLVDPNERGNSTSNILNGGAAAIKGDWIYFADLTRALKKIRADGTEETTLLDRGCNGGINVVGDWVYYTEQGGLAKVRTDGTEQAKIMEFGIGSDAECVTVIGEWIYFLKPTSGNPELCKVKTDGTEETLIESDVNDVNVVGDWIYYVNLPEQTFCKIKTDGTERSIVEVEETVQSFGTSAVSLPIVDGDYIYSRSSFGGMGVYRFNLDGSDVAHFAESGQTSEFAVADGWIYYVQTDPEHGSQDILYKMTIDGTEIVELAPSKENYYYDLNVVGEWIYFNGTNDSGRMAQFKIRTDGTEEQLISVVS
jgi:predicted small secreted protein